MVLAHIQYYTLLENILNYLYQKLLTENNLLGTETTKAKQELSQAEPAATAEIETSLANRDSVKKSQQLSQEVEHLVSELVKTLDYMIKEIINTLPVSVSLEVSQKLTPIQQHYLAELIPAMNLTSALSGTEVVAKPSPSAQNQKETSSAVSKSQAVQTVSVEDHQEQLAQLANSAKKVNQQITLIKMITLEHQVSAIEPLLIKLQVLNMLSDSFIAMQTRISPVLTSNQVMYMTHTVELFIGMREAMLGLNKTLRYVDSYRDLKNTQQSNDFIPKQYRY